MAESSIKLQEVLPKMGMIHRATYHDRHLEAPQDPNQDDARANIAIDMVLCKPKLLPMKSVTLEKLERMQREAQETVKAQEAAAEQESFGFSATGGGRATRGADVISDNPYDFS